MKAVILYYLRSFLFMTVAYGGSQFLVYLFIDKSPNFMPPLISGLGFGILMATFFTISQVAQVKKLRKGKLTTEALSVHQEAQLQTPLSKAQIIARLQNNYPTKDWEMTEDSDLIKLNTTFSAQSFGEKVTISVNSLQDGLSEVLLESRPKIRFTLADHGKNLKNIISLKN